jgi:hypothetical protein
MSEKQNVILIGSLREKENYLGVRTYYLFELLKKHLPDLKVGIYDVLAPDSERIELKADNFVFLPWVSTIDLKWCSFLLTLEELSNKILYTDDYYWYTACKNKLLKEGFNLENLFNIVAFSNRESASWWNDKQYACWGLSGPSESFSVQEKNNSLYVDKLVPIDVQAEPYNARRVILESIPELKRLHPDLKIVSQNQDSWVDVKLPASMPLEEILKYYGEAQAYVVTQHESCGLAQFDSRMMGTKIVTNKLFSKSSMLLPGGYTFEQWSFEEKNFLKAVERALVNYDSGQVRELSKNAWDEKAFIERVKVSLFNC